MTVPDLTPAEWTAVGTVATAVVAFLAACFAAWQVAVLQRTRSEQVRPYVVVDFRPHPASRTIIALVIENIGSTPAYDVSVEFTPKLKSTDDERENGSPGLHPVADSPLIKDGIPTMPPRRQIVVSFDSAPKRWQTKLPKRYDVAVRLKDSRGKNHTEHYIADMMHMYSLSFTEEKTVHHVASAMQDIGAQLRRWTDRHQRVRVSYRDDRADELDYEVEEFLSGDPSTEVLTGRAWTRALARNPFVRGAVAAAPLLHRWLRHRL